ncbi:MAG: hypothetical protein IPN90_10735 [Elusimicrobia bacterium]|nr:hypothetical protein [Elusimicrobiota bacterium]
MEYDAKNNEYFPSQRLEEVCEVPIQENEDDVFWDELMVRMAERDVKRESDNGANPMTPDEIFAAIGEKEEMYDEEFNDYGIARLEIIDHPHRG